MRVNRSFRRVGLTTLMVTILSVGVAVTPATAAGGAFSASYQGYFSIQNCSSGSSLVCDIALYGSGTASFLAKSYEVAHLIVTIPVSATACAPATGAGKVVSATATTNSISVTAAGKACLPASGQTGMRFTLYYTVKGGTGAYSSARGSGLIKGVANLTNKTHYEKWYGTLTY